VIALQIRRYGKWVGVIALLAVVATASATYILINQRLRLPTQERYTIYADLASSSGLTPGLGQPVNVAGVRVGQISGAELEEGVARIAMEIDPNKLPRVYDNARAALIANTPLKDMLLELGPGGPPGKPLASGGVIPVEATSPPIDSDELTNALDRDVRDFFQILVADLARGSDGRGKDFNQLLRALEPTTRQIDDITSALAARRRELKRLTGNLAILSAAAAEKDDDIAGVVQAANTTLQAVAGQDGALRASLDRLPGTVSSIRSSLVNVGDLADELRPTVDALLPAVRKLPAALADVDPLLLTAEPVLRDKIRPLVRRLAPIASDLTPAARDLSAVTPDLTTSFQVLNYVVNELGYNPPGSDEGYLYWTAWFAHNAASMLSMQDAHGAVWRGLALVSCDSLSAQPDIGPILDVLFGALQACKSK
jgi:phospholipid/cholesterol/gamma-HCH transport system substrate-binding protein